MTCPISVWDCTISVKGQGGHIKNYHTDTWHLSLTAPSLAQDRDIF